MPVGDHSEQGAGGSAQEGEEKKYRLRYPALALFGPAFVEAEGEEGNQGRDDEKILHEGAKVGIFREVNGELLMVNGEFLQQTFL